MLEWSPLQQLFIAPSPLITKIFKSNLDLVTCGFYNSQDINPGYKCTTLTFWGEQILWDKQIFEGHCEDLFHIAFSHSIFRDDEFEKITNDKSMKFPETCEVRLDDFFLCF